MGAWGVGLQANDTALDAIDERRLNKIMRDKDKKALKKRLEGIKAEWGDSWPQGVLGIAEFILDAGMPHTFLDTCRPIIDEAVALEKRKDVLDCWNDPEERRTALNLFRKRLQGKKVDQKALDKTNEGLLSKMTRGLGGVSYEEAYEEG